MGEIDRIKKQLTGQPVPEYARGVQACKLCAEVNDTVERYGAPPPRDKEFKQGDCVWFEISKKGMNENDEEDRYLLTDNVHHREHLEQYGTNAGFTGTKGYHDALVVAVLEETGYDYGRQRAERFETEYEPDRVEDALTLAQVDVLAYSAPERGRESTSNLPNEPDSSDYATPLELNPTWPTELQKQVYRHIQKHS